MNEEKLNGSGTTEDTNQAARRRISYVSKDLKSMIDFVGKVYSELGHTAYHSNKAIALVHGFSHDSIKIILNNDKKEVVKPNSLPQSHENDTHDSVSISIGAKKLPQPK